MSLIPTADNQERARKRGPIAARMRTSGSRGSEPPRAALEPGLDEAFDRLARMAAGLLASPAACIALVERGLTRLAASRVPEGFPAGSAALQECVARVIAAAAPQVLSSGNSHPPPSLGVPVLGS